MLIKPDISIYATAHRPENWMDLYRSIGDNDVSFEIVFVGPNDPDFELPDNFKFIKSCTKPAQCVEIAVRHTSADLIMNIADDIEFKTERPLDSLYNTYKSYNNDKLIVSCRYMLNGEIQSEDCHRFFAGDKSSPIMPLGTLMSKKLYFDIGGTDKNFIAVMWDLDIAMRVYALGGDVILSDVFLDEDKDKSAGSVLCSEFWRHDRGLLESLWTKNGKIHFCRTKPVEPFSDLNIIEKSQGKRGRWRGNGPVILEKIVDGLNKHLVKYRPLVSAACQAIRAIRRPAMYPKYTKKLLSRLIR